MLAEAHRSHDLPSHKTVYAMRDLDRLRAMAAEHGPNVGAYASALLDIPLPWTKMRHVYALRLQPRPSQGRGSCRGANIRSILRVVNRPAAHDGSGVGVGPWSLRRCGSRWTGTGSKMPLAIRGMRSDDSRASLYRGRFTHRSGCWRHAPASPSSGIWARWSRRGSRQRAADESSRVSTSV